MQTIRGLRSTQSIRVSKKYLCLFLECLTQDLSIALVSITASATSELKSQECPITIASDARPASPAGSNRLPHHACANHPLRANSSEAAVAPLRYLEERLTETVFCSIHSASLYRTGRRRTLACRRRAPHHTAWLRALLSFIFFYTPTRVTYLSLSVCVDLCNNLWPVSVCDISVTINCLCAAAPVCQGTSISAYVQGLEVPN